MFGGFGEVKLSSYTEKANVTAEHIRTGKKR